MSWLRFAQIGPGGAPVPAVVLVGGIIAALTLVGNVKTTWSFSAFTVLVYYALTNLSALRLAPRDRLYPRWVSGLGLVGCLSLAWWVEPPIWLGGLAWLGIGHVARWIGTRVWSQGEAS